MIFCLFLGSLADILGFFNFFADLLGISLYFRSGNVSGQMVKQLVLIFLLGQNSKIGCWLANEGFEFKIKGFLEPWVATRHVCPSI